MAVKFVLGRAGTGKTRYCLDALAAALAEPGDQSPLILLVPEQASFQMERALALRGPGGGFWRAAVLSFSRLARRFFEQIGQEPAILRAAARELALRRVIAERGDALGPLMATARTAGFYQQLHQLIEEFLREAVSPAELAEAAGRLPDEASAERVQTIADFYAAYLDWLGPERIDEAGRLERLRECLGALPDLAATRIWVDGFAGFTGQELHTLVSLAQQAREVVISLLVDPAGPALGDSRHPPDMLSLFFRTEQTYQRLTAELRDAGVGIAPPIELTPSPPPRFVGSADLATLEANLSRPLTAGPLEDRDVADDDTGKGAGAAGAVDNAALAQVRVVSCATQRDELRAAARDIRQRIADSAGRLHFRDFAVIARDLEPLADLVDEVFGEYEIPYFLDRRRPLHAHPLSRLVPTLLDVVRTDCAIDTMVRLLRTRLLPMSRTTAERLEIQAVNGAYAGTNTWRAARWALEETHTDTAVDADRLRLVVALDPLFALAEDDAPATGATWARTIHDGLTRLEVAERIAGWIAAAQRAQRWESAETHRLAWGGLCAVLDDLHDVLGDVSLTGPQVGDILRTALKDLTLGLAPPTLDQVLVSAIERSRHPDITHAWLVGFNEGIFPAAPPDDVLLSTADREALRDVGLAAPAARQQDAFSERLLAYIAFTRPAQTLTISYANVDAAGETLLPSPLLAELQRALPHVSVTPAEPFAPAVTLTELARDYLAARSDDRRAWESRRSETIMTELRDEPPRAQLLDRLLCGVAYANRPGAIRTVADDRPGPAEVVWRGSPSQIETFVQCPFRHFAAYRLGLDSARGPRPTSWELGSAAHEILADLTRRAINQPEPIREIADERWRQLLDDAVAGYWQRQPTDLQQRRPDYALLARVLVDRLQDLVLAQAERWRRGEFEPRFCEQRFDPGDTERAWPALIIRLDEGRVAHLVGQIDRVDICTDGGQTWTLVCDYKSSAEGVKSPFLTGNRLQLFTYLLAALQARPAGEALPAGVLLAPLYPDVSVLDNKYAQEANEIEQRMFMFRPKGLINADVAELIDANLGTTQSPVLPMRKLKTKPGFHHSSHVVSSDELVQRLDLARRTIDQAIAGMIAGCVDVAPLVESQCLACKWCDFRSVCRFDRAYNDVRAAEVALPQLEQVDDVGGDA